MKTKSSNELTDDRIIILIKKLKKEPVENVNFYDRRKNFYFIFHQEKILSNQEKILELLKKD